MRRHGPRFSNFQIGLVVLIVGGLVSYFGLTKTNPFHKGYKIHAVFASALSNGVHPGSPVRIAGVNVGKVTGVKRGAGQTVDVTMEVTNAGRPIHDDATIKARPRIFLEGNYFLEIQPGTAQHGELANGGTIPLSQTAIPVQLDQVLGAFTAPTRQSQRDVIDAFDKSLRQGGSAAVREGYEAGAPAFKGTAVSMQALRGTQTGDLARFVASQARVSQTLDDNRLALADLITRFRQTNDVLASRQQQLAATLPALRSLLDAAPPSLNALDRMLPPLRTISRALKPSLAIAPRVLDHGIPFSRSLATLLRADRLDALLRYVRPSVEALRGLERSLPKGLEYAEKVAQCGVRNVLPVINMQAPDGHLSSNQPAWQDLLHGLANLNSAQQDFGGDGYSTRYSFGLGQNVIVTSLTSENGLIQLSGSPLVGARPKWTPGRQPPYRPDVPCETQPVLQNIDAETVGPVGATRTIHLTPTKPLTRTQLKDRIQASLDRLRKKVAK